MVKKSSGQDSGNGSGSNGHSGPSGAPGPSSSLGLATASNWDLRALTGSTLAGMLSTALSAGGFVGFGTVRENGALCIVVKTEAGSEKLYAHSDGEIAEYCQAISQFFDASM